MTSDRIKTVDRVTSMRTRLGWLTIVTTVVAVIVFSAAAAADGFNSIEIVLTSLAATLLLGIAMSFWTATLGFVDAWRDEPREDGGSSSDADEEPLAATAILMPVYNESPDEVFAGVEAMRRSLVGTDHARSFDIFVLSDTTDPDVWIDEEVAWARVSKAESDVRVYYRHRRENRERKAGNIADFCRRWGESYEYMVVLDADSVMAGETLVEMVRRMQADDEIGILQVPPRPVGCDSLFARLQQFAARTYSLPFLRGFKLWAGDDGNYWGHNAIIRTDAFVEHCGLPKLPGQAPLGGEILSHDFVEAALMRRGGYKVCLADDLEGSYEQCPTGLTDYAQRDQRWCQGNLQHGRILAANGLGTPSRMHLLMGVMSYVASPIWLMFLLISLWAAVWSYRVEGAVWGPIALFVASMSMLLIPKLYGVLLTLRDDGLRQAQGGTVRVVLSAFLETAASVLIAPVMMLYHSRFVAYTLSGKSVPWNAQARDDRAMPLRDAWNALWWAPVSGVIATIATVLVSPSLLPWMSPILAGLLLAVPLASVLSSPGLGRLLRRVGLLLVPEESNPPAVLKERDRILATMEHETSDFWRLVQDPQVLSLHTEILRASGGEHPLSQRDRRRYLKKASSYGALSRDERRQVQSDATLLTEIHFALRTGVRA